RVSRRASVFHVVLGGERPATRRARNRGGRGKRARSGNTRLGTRGQFDGSDRDGAQLHGQLRGDHDAAPADDRDCGHGVVGLWSLYFGLCFKTNGQRPKTKHKVQRTKYMKLSPTEIYKDRKIFLIGSTGFLGKVTLSMLLHRFPNVGKIYLTV